jgi:hypothetical protein
MAMLKPPFGTARRLPQYCPGKPLATGDAWSMLIEGVGAYALFAVANFLRFHPQIALETVIEGPLYLIHILRVDQEDQTNFKRLGFIHMKRRGLCPTPRLTTYFFDAAFVQ